MTAPFQIPGLQALQRRSDNKRFAELEADLMPTLVALRLDTKRTTYVGRKGNLTCWLVDVELGARKKEPALLLVNRTNPAERNTFLPLGQLWRVIDPSTPGEQRAQMEDVRLMAEQLFGFVTTFDTTTVLDAIYDFAEDLKNAKPPPQFTLGQWLQALAEDDMVLLHNGQRMNG